MPLTLVLGPANSSKAGEVLGAYAAATPRGGLLVVPTGADAEHYVRELASERCVLGSVLTFAALGEEVARRAGYDGRRMSALQRERVLRRAASAAPLALLGSVADTPGFVSAAGDLVAELERSLTTPERFTEAMGKWAAEDQRRKSYADDVATIYSAYADQLEAAGRTDAELYMWRALDALRAAPARWGGDQVFFYGFDDLHALERDAIETLSRVVDVEVTVSLTYEVGRVALQARAELVEELRQIAQRVVELPAVDDYYAARSRAALHHLERGLFEGPSDRLDPGAAVRLLETSGERAEAELVGAEVLALLGAGVPAEEIAVVYRSLPDRPVIEHVFRSYGISIAIDRRVPFGHTTLGRSVLVLARCALLGEEQTQAQDVVTYLRSPGLLDRPEVVDALETRIRCEGLRTAAQARDRIRFSLDEIDALRQAADPMAELERSARRLLALPNRGKAALLAGDEELDARALATMSRALADCKELGEALAGSELIQLVEGLRVPAGSPARDGAVLVTEPLPIRARRFRAVFLCGLQEQEFPRLSAPEPFLSDERRWELAATSGLRLRPREDALARERYLFYACASRATEQVVFSYRSSDEEGNLALPSPFLADVSDLFVEGWRERRRRRLLADVVWPPEEAPTERELARSLAASSAPSAGDGEPPARFLGPAALAHVRHMEIVSAGALEAYADCPMKWLVERELQLARIDPDPDPLARGAYMHRLLEEVVRRLGGAVTPASLPDALRVLDEVVADLPDGIAAGRPPGVRAAVAAALTAGLRRYLRHEAAGGCGWEPRGLELRFGFSEEEESLPALQLGEGAERTLLRGVIDRVDVDPAGRRAVVRDYKSGARRPEHPVARWRADRQLQVALYMVAVRELLELEPVAGLYQPLGGEDLRARGMYLKEAPLGSMVVAGDGRDEEELRAELEYASECALEVAARLRAGELTPCPETCSPNGCRHPGICRSS